MDKQEQNVTEHVLRRFLFFLQADQTEKQLHGECLLFKRVYLWREDAEKKSCSYIHIKLD